MKNADTEPIRAGARDAARHASDGSRRAPAAKGRAVWLCLLALAAALALSGCGGSSGKTASKGNLEPELTGLEALRQSRGRPLTDAERQALASRPEIQFRLTEEETQEVQLFFQYFTREKRDTAQRWMLRSEPHLEYVRAVLASHRLPQDLMALPFIESGYNVMAVSNAGAVGMWQFMPATAKRFGLTVDWWLDERRDPYLSTVAAARYFKVLHDQFGDWQLALAAYNAGEGSVSRAMASTGKKSFKSLAAGSPLKEETKHYVPKFLAMLKILKNAKRLGFQAPSMKASKDLQEVRVPPGSDLASLANHLGLSWEQFHAVNPAYRRQLSPPDRTTAAWLPKHMARPATAWLERPDSGKTGPGTRLARSGETWWSLSRETGIPAAVLREANRGMDNPSPGRPLRVPLAACALDGPSSSVGPQPVPTGKSAVAQAKGSPAPAPAPASVSVSAAAQPTLYVVRGGDTLASVARKAGVSEQELASFNKANPKDALTPGTPLLIPTKGPEERPQDLNPTPAYRVVKRKPL